MTDLPSWLVSIIASIYPGIVPPTPYVYDGYVEGDFTYAAPATAGRIEEIAVVEGGEVSEGALIFALRDAQYAAALRAAEAQLAQAEATLVNLSTGSRDAETAVIRASLDQARVALDIARTRLERSEALLDRGATTQAAVDDQRAAVDEAKASVAQLEAELSVAELPARDAERRAAEAVVEAARAQVDLARSDLEDRKVFAPVSGRVEKVYFTEGEVASAGTPVVSILPPDGRIALFFVPEAERADLEVGDEVALSCEGCAPDLTATITRLASDPQYTPPILYTREARGRLVYRVEATVEGAANLRPGQPVTVDASTAAEE
ncbi:HlyD family secretion protein [Celeribacter litoreus]|uniref:HlyD family secretion protein n=1 Tax=Celeribacter litoreus TaxID=2876714 RepID=UPI001CC9BC25|nr:HlyD family efflux transporter periplasmic adaptor subunit [Celeribacter litoreus]MCA0043277.1 HlyD family efflux transporter periplasmic adaptor subunit [Celeribacter litoreus]